MSIPVSRDLERYAELVIKLRVAKQAEQNALDQLHKVQAEMEEAWEFVRGHIDRGTMKPGIYRVRAGGGPFAHGLNISRSSHLPELQDMYDTKE